MSTVNKAGNYTKPTMRKKIFQRIKSQASHGTRAGQWSARKAQALAKAYKKAGVELSYMTKADFEAWLAIAKKSSYLSLIHI